jgi:hypothetical protein
MASLKDLWFTDFIVVESLQLQELFVGNDSNTANNGGSCCLWEVPEGTAYIKFEMWGGGGGGAGACCCQQGCGGSGGSYSIKTLSGSQVVAGCEYTICGAGSTAQSNTCCGFPGNTSFVIGHNLSNFCARGGAPGDTKCFQYISCYQRAMCYGSCCATGGDINVHSAVSTAKTTIYCYNNSQMLTTVAPATVSGPIYGPTGCSIAGAGECAILAPPIFPGGGGQSGQTYAGICRCGWWGAAGLVLVTFG